MGASAGMVVPTAGGDAQGECGSFRIPMPPSALRWGPGISPKWRRRTGRRGRRFLARLRRVSAAAVERGRTAGQAPPLPLHLSPTVTPCAGGGGGSAPRLVPSHPRRTHTPWGPIFGAFFSGQAFRCPLALLLLRCHMLVPLFLVLRLKSGAWSRDLAFPQWQGAAVQNSRGTTLPARVLGSPHLTEPLPTGWARRRICDEPPPMVLHRRMQNGWGMRGRGWSEGGGRAAGRGLQERRDPLVPTTPPPPACARAVEH
eukprot:gene5635-biopygen14791